MSPNLYKNKITGYQNINLNILLKQNGSLKEIYLLAENKRDKLINFTTWLFTHFHTEQEIDSMREKKNKHYELLLLKSLYFFKLNTKAYSQLVAEFFQLSKVGIRVSNKSHDFKWWFSMEIGHSHFVDWHNIIFLFQIL